MNIFNIFVLQLRRDSATVRIRFAWLLWARGSPIKIVPISSIFFQKSAKKLLNHT